MVLRVQDLLRSGGYILYARHGEATAGTDSPNLDFRFCETQRNLSETGKMQAVTYGNFLRRLQVPVMSPVITSPYCRAIDTAQLAFGNAYIRIDMFWAQINDLSGNMTPDDRARVLAQLQTKLESIPPRGYNQVIIAHSFPDGMGLGEIPYMGTVVVSPLGPGKGYEITARLSLEDLARLNGIS